MLASKLRTLRFLVLLVGLATLAANAQSFRVQCPVSTITHPSLPTAIRSPRTTVQGHLRAAQRGYLTPTANVNSAAKCQQILGGDGFATIGSGTQTYMFSFGPLSGSRKPRRPTNSVTLFKQEAVAPSRAF